MKSAMASISKNLALVGVLALSAVNFFYHNFSWQEIIIVQCAAGVIYIALSCYEYLNANYKASLPVQRYPYFTNSFVMFRLLKIGVFSSFAILLYTSNSPVKYLYPICLIIASTEGVTTFLKYKKSLCFVNIYANYLLIAQTKLVRLFASEILLIEFRHYIFYFVKKNRKTVLIKLDHIENEDEFIRNLNNWIIRNNIPVSAESKEKIRNMAQKVD